MKISWCSRPWRLIWLSGLEQLMFVSGITVQSDLTIRIEDWHYNSAFFTLAAYTRYCGYGIWCKTGDTSIHKIEDTPIFFDTNNIYAFLKKLFIICLNVLQNLACGGHLQERPGFHRWKRNRCSNPMTNPLFPLSIPEILWFLIWVSVCQPSAS